MKAILEPLIRSPKFLGYLDELNELRRCEEDARERFRRDSDEDVRGEFINGEVIIQMTSRDEHTMTVRNVGRLMDAFTEQTRLGTVRIEQALTGFARNDYAPDICFWGTAKELTIGKKTSIYPTPDLICEVLSSSTEARDRGVKFEDYAAHGVGEYWIIDPEAEWIEQHVHRQGKFESAGRFADGIIRSVVIGGFEMPVRAAFDRQVNQRTLLDMLGRI